VNSFFIISILIPNPLSLIPNLHSLRYEHAYVLAVLQQFAHGGGTDAGKFRLGEEQDSFYAGQFAVDVGNGFLVFEIFHGAYAAYYQTGIYLPGKVDSQAVIGLHNDARLVPVVVSYHLFALFQGEIRILIFIDADAYDDFVYKSQCTAHYRRVSDSKRVECSRKDSSSHDAKS